MHIPKYQRICYPEQGIPFTVYCEGVQLSLKHIRPDTGRLSPVYDSAATPAQCDGTK